MIKILRRYMWIYERNNWDRGIVFAWNRKSAIKKLSRIYPDTYKRIEDEDNWMYVFSTKNIDVKGEVFITIPY